MFNVFDRLSMLYRGEKNTTKAFLNVSTIFQPVAGLFLTSFGIVITEKVTEY